MVGAAGTEEDSRDGPSGICPTPGAVQLLACRSAAGEAPLTPYITHILLLHCFTLFVQYLH